MSDEQLALYDDFDEPAEEPRSLLSTLWFRAVLTISAVGVVAAFTLPYTMSPTPPAAMVRPPAVVAPSTPPAAVTSPMVLAAPEVTTPAAPPAPADAVAVSTTAPTPAPPARATEPSVAPVTTTFGPPTKDDVPLRVPEAPRANARSLTAGGAYWIQVGAYKDADVAKNVATRLRGQGYPVEPVLPPAADAPAPTPASAVAAPLAVSVPPAVDKYEVVVTGAAATTLSQRLTAKGLSAEATKAGVVVRPALPLAEAMTLSKDFAGDGLKVQVRRVAAPAVVTPVPVAPASALVVSADGLHRVRVGAFTDRDAAVATLRELSEKGYPGFIARSTP